MKRLLKNNIYPFQGRDVLQHPEIYHYFDCLTPDFIGEYINQRTMKIDELSSITGTNFSDEKKTINQGNINELLIKSLEELKIGSSLRFDRFCVKFETHQKFYSSYDRDTLQPRKDKGLAANETYIIFPNACVMLMQTLGI